MSNDRIEVEFEFMFLYGEHKGGGAYNLSSPVIIPEEKLLLVKQAIESVLNASPTTEPAPAEKESGGDEWTWENRFCYNDLMRAMMAMAGWCSQIRMRDAIHGTEAGNYSDEFIKKTWPERLSTTEPVEKIHALYEELEPSPLKAYLGAWFSGNPIKQTTEPVPAEESFWNILQENYEAAKRGDNSEWDGYDCRKAVIETYEDLIALYKLKTENNGKQKSS